MNKTNSQKLDSLLLSGKPILAYLMYPFNINPNETTKKVRKLALKIMEKHPQIIVLVPHFCVDALLMGTLDFNAYLKDNSDSFPLQKHIDAGHMCLNIIYKADMIILGKKLDYKISSGMMWERIFMEWLNTTRSKSTLIIDIKELLPNVKE